MHKSAAATTIVMQGRRPFDTDDDNIDGKEKRAARVMVSNALTHRGPGLMYRERSQNLFAHLTKSTRNLGQRGSNVPELSRSNSFGSMASASVNGVFGDSGDSDFASSDDEGDNNNNNKGVRIRRKNSRSKRSPWMSLDQLASSSQAGHQQLGIFDNVQSGTRRGIDNLSISNIAESDEDFRNPEFSRDDAFRSNEALNASASSILAQRLAPVSPRRLTAFAGTAPPKKSTLFRPITSVDEELTLMQQEQIKVTTQITKSVQVAPLLEAAIAAPLGIQTLNDHSRVIDDAIAEIGTLNDSNKLATSMQTIEIDRKTFNQHPKERATMHTEVPLVGQADAPPRISIKSQDLSTISSKRQANVSFSENQMKGSPSFEQFTLFSIHRNTLATSIGDENLFRDEGPRHLDAFAMSQIDAVHIFPSRAANPVLPEELAQFCIPDGLRVRLLPRAALEGAQRLGWLDQEGDRCHAFVMPLGSNQRYHGVAIRVCDVVAFPVHEMHHFVRTIRVRQRRRWAATKICRWYKLLQRRDWIVTEALRISGYPNHAKEICQIFTLSDLQHFDIAIKKSRSDSHVYIDDLNEVLDDGAARIYEMLDSAVQTRTDKNGLLQRPSSGNLLSRSGGNRQLATVDGTSNKQRRRLGTSTRMVQSERVAIRVMSPSNDAKAGRRFSSERISFIPSFRKVISPSVATKNSEREYPMVIRNLAKEAMEAAEYADLKGFVVLVEKCYSVVGCQPDEQVLLLNALQKLVDTEREELRTLRKHLLGLNPTQRSRLGKVWDGSERRVFSCLEEQRENILASMAKKLQLTRKQLLVDIPKSQLEAIQGPHHVFEARLSIRNASPIRLPLPLPSVGREWGLSKLLLAIGSDSLIQAVKILLLERSILVVGEDQEDTTSCCFALLELLKPFEWVHLFRPTLSPTMLGSLVTSKPFVAGMASRDLSKMMAVESEEPTFRRSIVDMSVINLLSGMLHVTTEQNVLNMLNVDPSLSERLRSLRSRLQYFVDQDASSPVCCFKSFIRNGLSPRERLTLRSICTAFETFILRFCGTLNTSVTDWGRYSIVDDNTSMFHFKPELFMQSWNSDQLFLESLVNTQLFSEYVCRRRQSRINLETTKDREASERIAMWIQYRWTLRKCHVRR